MNEFDIKLNLAIDKALKFRNICEDRSWNIFKKSLKEEFGPRDVVAGIARYVMQDYEDGKIPVPLDMEDIYRISNLIYNSRFPMTESCHNLDDSIKIAVRTLKNDPFFKYYMPK